MQLVLANAMSLKKSDGGGDGEWGGHLFELNVLTRRNLDHWKVISFKLMHIKFQCNIMITYRLVKGT